MSTVRIPARFRDLNARLNGVEAYRLALSGESLVWLDRHPDVIVVSDNYPRKRAEDAFLAAERKGATIVEAPSGLLVVTITHDLSRGRRRGAPTYRAAVTNAEGLDFEAAKHVGVKRSGDRYVHVVEIDGVRKELAS